MVNGLDGKLRAGLAGGTGGHEVHALPGAQTAMTDVQIRLAQVNDAEPACAVLRRSIAGLCEADHGNDPKILAAWLANKTPDNVAAWIVDPGNIVTVALIDGRITGVAAMTQAGLITLNYVSPDARFSGVSKALLAALEQSAVDLELAQCRLQSTKTALRFYRAAGYREVEADNSGGGVMMTKELIVPRRFTIR